MNLLEQGERRQHESGQVFVLFAMSLPILILFIGLAIDFGFAYVTKTSLSKAVDAAALAAMSNIAQGQAEATTIAQSAFNANYLSSVVLDAAPPVFNISFTTNSSNNTVVNVTATATIDTFFLRLLPGYQTLTVSSTAQATRPKLIMSLVLDVSTSMTRNGGSTALAPAVESFVDQFDPHNNDMIDLASMVTFGTSSVVNVAMTQPFQTKIDDAVSNISWGVANYTNSYAGLSTGLAQITSVPAPAGENVVKVAVFFTDGWPNIIQDNLQCGGKATNVLYCGCDTGDESLGLCNSTPVEFFDPSSCSATDNSCNTVSCNPESYGGAQNTFPSQQTGTSEELVNVNDCSADAMYRAIQVAKSMQAQNIYVYSIGLGTAITNQPVAEDFLRQVANDPASSTYNSSLPTGEALFAPTAADLEPVFQTVAAEIVLRLSQ